MNVTIIGTGNTATVLGRLIRSKGHVIHEVVGRNANAAKELADELQTKCSNDLSKLGKNSHIYIIAVADAAIADVAGTVKIEAGIVLHTSGSLPANVLQKASLNYGVLYPLQSLRKELTYQPVIPFLVDANTESNLTVVRSFAESLSPYVSVANDEKRLKLHIAAVVASNFTNHLYALTKDYCDTENIPFEMLIPLITEVANRLQFFEPANMQTGPAVRGDIATIEKHLEMLSAHGELKNMYSVITKSIQEFHRK